jgi:hypothetical protein
MFDALPAFGAEILAWKNRPAAIGAGLGYRLLFSYQRVAAPLAKTMFIAMHGMALRTDSHNGVFLIMKRAKRPDSRTSWEDNC